MEANQPRNSIGARARGGGKHRCIEDVGRYEARSPVGVGAGKTYLRVRYQKERDLRTRYRLHATNARNGQMEAEIALKYLSKKDSAVLSWTAMGGNLFSHLI